MFEPIRAARAAKSGHQSGDPARAAQALLTLIASEHPPVHLLLGSDALAMVRAHLAELQKQLHAWESLSVSTDFPASSPLSKEA
jgi:hypothetical protein